MDHFSENWIRRELPAFQLIPRNLSAPACNPAPSNFLSVFGNSRELMAERGLCVDTRPEVFGMPQKWLPCNA